MRELINKLRKLDGEMEVVTEIITKDEAGYTDVIECDSIMLFDEDGKSKRAALLKTKFWIYEERVR